MAMTEVEKKRAQRARKKEQQLADLKSGSSDAAKVSKRSFSDTFQDDPDASDFELSLGLVGMVAPDFSDDLGPLDHALPHTIAGAEEPFGDASGSIGRAEVTIGCLITAAITLAGIVNKHLKTEIKDQLTDLESSQDIDRATAMKEAVKLNKMLDRLDKQVRWTFPEWKVTGK